MGEEPNGAVDSAIHLFRFARPFFLSRPPSLAVSLSLAVSHATGATAPMRPISLSESCRKRNDD